MNDPNKAINVNLSSLLSLKAELLRKQAEVSKVKATRTTAEDYVANKTSCSSGGNSTKRRGKERVNEPDEKVPTVIEHEDSALLEKSQRVLVAKSKFYDRMSRAGGKLNSDDNCLVLFNRKRQEESYENCEMEPPRCSSEHNSSSSDEADDPEDDWVEYTDCLGRTRKCLRKNLEEVKKRDSDLAASMPERLDQTKANWMIDTQGTPTAEDEDETPIGPLPPDSVYSDGCSLVSKHDEQRANWERKEQENLDKGNVHYQDVFFDEARQHGVGYYAFSTDEEERKKQQRDLEESRQRTVNEQDRRDTLRAQREKIIAERVRAAKNRQRARLGLPPLDESEDQQATDAAEHEETKEERKMRKREEKLKKKQELAEKERELERQQHVRPWDKDKEGATRSSSSSSTSGFEEATETEWSYKPEREPMSQAEWNEQKRAERNPEFAPVQDVQPMHLKRKHFSSMPPPLAPPTQPMNHYNMMPPPPLPRDTFTPYQSTKREKHFQRRSYVNEGEEVDRASMGAAIPPPADLDAHYQLPPQAKKSKGNTELERSIEAGLRFLRENCDKDTLSSKSSWTAKADY